MSSNTAYDYQVLKLIDYTQTDFILGSLNGNQILSKLMDKIWVRSTSVEISLEGITGVDACFIRNSIASLSRMLLSQKGVVVSHVENKDVLDNLIYGFHAINAPLLLKNNDGSGAIYAKLPSGAKEILSYVYSQSNATTQKVVKQFDISAPNASAKLKKLYKEGYLLAEQQDAPTGGIEYVYSPIFTCRSLTYPTHS